MTTFVHCRGCGHKIHESATTCPQCGAPQQFANQQIDTAQPATTAKLITSIEDTPWFRRRWFFVVCVLIFIPAALLIAFTGDVYYLHKGELKTLAKKDRNFILVLFICLVVVNVFRGVVDTSTTETFQPAVQVITPATIQGSVPVATPAPTAGQSVQPESAIVEKSTDTNTAALTPSVTNAQNISTRFGGLSVNAENVLLYKNHPLNPSVVGNNSLSAIGTYQIGNGDVVLIQDNGGSACPALYYFVTVTASSAKATPSFGTCTDLIEVKKLIDSISISMPGFVGSFESEQDQKNSMKEKHIFIFKDNVLTEDGKVVTSSN